MAVERRLQIPQDVPEDFANAVATVLILGVAGGSAWDIIYHHPPDRSLDWINSILKSNDTADLLHADLKWWERQLRGH